MPGFTGIISDLGGPTANMWRLHCKDPKIEAACRRLSCVYPGICKNMKTDQMPLVRLYRKARALPGIKRVFIASGLRYDLAVETPEYVKELVTHHVGGYLKIAPEHIEPGPLAHMMKPGIGTYDRFKAMQASLRSRERFWDIRVPKIDSIFDNSLVPRPSWSPGVPPQHRKLVAATHRSPI